MMSKRDKLKSFSSRWTDESSFDSLVGSPNHPSKSTVVDVPLPHLFRFTHDEQSTDIPASGIPQLGIPIESIPASIISPIPNKSDKVNSAPAAKLPVTTTIPPIGIPDKSIPVAGIPQKGTPPFSKSAFLGYFLVPNSLVDSLFSTFSPHEAALYLRLFRLSYGFNTDVTTKVGFLKLSMSTGLARSTVQEKIKSLLLRNYIQSVHHSLIGEDGSSYRVYLPEKIIPLAQGLSQGFFRVPNVLFDNLLPLLSAPQQIIYLILWRMSFGFNSSTTCCIGYKKLCELSGMKKNPVIAAVRSLLAEKYIACLNTSQQGSSYRVFEPFEISKINVFPPHNQSILNTQTIPIVGIPAKGIPQPGIPDEGKQVYLNSTDGIPNGGTITYNALNNTTTTADVVDALCLSGINKKVATQLSNEYPADFIKEKIALINKKKSTGKIKDVAGSLVAAIRDDWTNTKIQQQKASVEKSIGESNKIKENIKNIISKAEAGEFISSLEYGILPEDVKDLFKVDSDFYKESMVWRYRLNSAVK